MDQVTVSYIVAAGALGGVIFGYVGYVSGVKKDTYVAGEKTGEQQADTSYIKKRVDDILLEQRDTNRKLEGHGAELSDHAVKIARLEESAKSAHKRIDTLEEKG
ncbi:hypothetical protein [Desulfosporosinus sp. SB140]|uniref:hypothetical protein n=1 Tax=Desulfosporosinus paludis TaxID=3115649 RepID=UPI00388F9958